LCGLVKPIKGSNITDARPQGRKVPDSWDWRNVSGVNYVPPVRAQRKCAACYAFAATGTWEVVNSVRGHYRWGNATRPQAQGTRWTPIKASEQQIIDCAEDTNGCVGGFYTLAWDYEQKRGFVATDTSYPYRARVTAPSRGNYYSY